MPHIEMYVTRSCGYCVRAKALLRQKGVAWEEIDVSYDADRRDEMEDRSSRYTVPQIFIDGQHIGGYDDLAALDRAGGLDALLATS